MQLVYLYINKYCSFHRAEFNFSPELHLHFDEDRGTLTASDTQFRLPETFWGENINNLSVVVGNNGAGKTSLMQAIIEFFLDAHGHKSKSGQGMIIFRDGKSLFIYCNPDWNIAPVKSWVGFEKYGQPQWLDHSSVKGILGATKMIYLTNALTMRDVQRSQWYQSDRSAPLYDCSMGNLLVSDASKDVNQATRSGSLELESYLLYEQYKQIKFVFDKRQQHICADLKAKGYPMPVPKKLYIDLLLENRLSAALDVDDFAEEYDILYDLDSILGWKLERRFFPRLYPSKENRQVLNTEPISGYEYALLRQQLSRCAIWCAVRSAANAMNDNEKKKLRYLLEKWRPSTSNYTGTSVEAWEEINLIMEHFGALWNDLSKHCLKFLQFIYHENLETHFKIETELWGAFHLDVDRSSIAFSVDTTDSDWFMDFLEQYRRICEPDYFLDFRWGLSSGENSLLSLFSSLYYIYGEDYANSLNGDYQISNMFRHNELVPCDSVILLIDEADLTYHPDWQRVFIDLLTAFLPQVYPPRCCQNIQIILSTHSPILLSDVPQQGVIYLTSDPTGRHTTVDSSGHTGTFGQNIHLLFRDSFFLTHGTIGRFAERKINFLFNELKRIEASLDSDAEVQSETLGYELQHKWRPYAELIAEPIIRRKALMWIQELEEKLSWSGQEDRVRRLSDGELEREFVRLKRELDRRNHDTNFDL